MELWNEGHIDEIDLAEAYSLQSGQSAPVPFHSNPSPPPILSTPKNYKPRSTTFPALQGNPNVWAFTQQVTNKIRKTKWKGLTQSNLTLAQKEALRSLQQETRVTIKPSDKGGNLVVMDNSQYESMVMKLLQNFEWYRKIPESHVNYTITKYTQLLGSAYHQGLINKKNGNFSMFQLPKFLLVCSSKNSQTCH